MHLHLLLYSQVQWHRLQLGHLRLLWDGDLQFLSQSLLESHPTILYVIKELLIADKSERQALSKEETDWKLQSTKKGGNK